MGFKVVAAASAIALTATAAGAAYADEGAVEDGVIDNAKATHLHHDQQHGDIEGHLPAENLNGKMTVVSKLALRNVEPGKIADVGVHNGYAYLAAWGSVTCKYNGVHVVDIRNPEAPREVAFIGAKEGSAPGEGIQALTIDTPQFKGDILVSNNEKCKERAGFGGLNIYDVTRPTSPTPLTEGFGDSTVPGQGKKAANEIHSVFAWDAGDKAYAVIVDNEEAADVDIVDISNPRKPRLIKEYDLAKEFPEILQEEPANLTDVFLHDIVVKQIEGKYILLASYWDGGYVQLDVTDPMNATLISDSDFALDDPELLDQTGAKEKPEGNAHQAEFTDDNKYIVAADEDFSPLGLTNTNTTDKTGFFGVPGDATKPFTVGTTLTAPTSYVGLACATSEAVPAPAGKQIAVIARGTCSFTEKIASIDAANTAAAATANEYIAAIVVNREGADACGPFSMSVEGATPALSVERSVGYGLFDIEPFDAEGCLAGSALGLPGLKLGTTGDSVSIRAFFDGWGYVHLYGPGTDGKLKELDTWAIPEAMNAGKATGSGDLSVHEVAVSLEDPKRQYYAYYSGGVRVTEIRDDKLVEVGSFIDEGGNNFWGVEVFTGPDGEEYIAASDRDHGLYILKYTP